MNEPEPEKIDWDAKLREYEEYQREHSLPICSGVQEPKEEKKCPECDGEGSIMDDVEEEGDDGVMYSYTEEMDCPECEGKGTVKVTDGNT